MNQYLIPANSKKSKLIFGWFTGSDLIIACFGILLTVLFLVILKEPKFWELIVAMIPLLTVVTLVFPIPNYHNVRQLLSNIFYFFACRRKYYWKGWCVKDDED